MLKPQMNKITLGIQIALLASAGLSASAIAQAQQQAEEDVERIQVTGIRGSIKENLNAKRFSSAVLDSISAEDIGKFPDKNVADTLSRIPGITIDRSFGEGEGVTIRGFSPTQNVTLLNGQAVGTAQWFILNQTGRNFNFELLASELVGTVDVYKSPQADIEEGGLGGTVIVHTRKPLSMEGNTFAGSVEAQYSDVPEKWDPSGSALYNWTNDDETFGVVVSGSFQKRTVERHSQESDFGWFGPGIARIEPGLSAPSTDGVGNPGPEKGSLPWGVGSAVFKQDRERTGIDTTVQYAPSDDFDISVHYLFSELSASNVNSNLIGIPFRGLFAGSDNARPGTVENGFVTSLSYFGNPDQEGWVPQFLAYDNIYRDGSKAQTQVFDIESNYQISDDVAVHIQTGFTKGESQINDFFTEFWADPRNPDAGIIFSNPNPSEHGASIDFNGANPWLTNPGDDMFLGVVFDQQNETEDKESYLQGDLSFTVEFGVIDEIKVGAKVKDREFSQFRIRDDLSNTGLFGDESLGPASAFWSGDLLSPSHSGNSLPSSSYWLPNQGLIRDAFEALPECSSDTSTSCRNSDVVQAIANFQIDELITNLYVMANFSGDGFRGNFGIRYAKTDTDINGADNNGNPVTFVNDYDELLPSANISFDLTPTLIARASAARVLNRPSPFSLAPAFNLTPETGRGNSGNPNLKPTLANQFDLGLEWYFDDASLASITWFKKDINQFIFNNTVQATINGVVFNQLTRPENGGNSDFEGLELQLTHNFDNGFGGFFNFTYVDASPGLIQRAELIPATTDADGNIVTEASAALVNEEIEFPDVSKTAYNIGAFYEDETFSARVTYTWRDEYFTSNTEFGPTFRDDRGQVDAQISYNVTDNITLKVEAVNLTNEIFRNFLVQDGNLAHPSDGTKVISSEGENGRRFYIGANFKF